MTIETAKTLAGRHGGQIEREIMWLVEKVEALENAGERLSVCAAATLDMCERMGTEKARLVTCAGAAINAWVEGEMRTAFDGEMASLARLLIEMEESSAIR